MTLLRLILLCALVAAAPAAALDEDLYATLLSQHTREVPDLARVRVDYAALARSPEWKALVLGLAATDPSRLGSRDERLAFWINAYNILAIDLVARHWPVSSIRDIGSFFSPVWKREAGRIGGRAYSLDEIEHGILRPMGDPRVHAAVVCASTSCPALRREPFRAASVGAQLDDAMRGFLADTGKGLAIDRAANTVRLSKIFDWFEEDFAPSPLAFATRFAPDAARRFLEAKGSDLHVDHFDYDWGVNATTSPGR